jgi:hypothetical protein
VRRRSFIQTVAAVAATTACGQQTSNPPPVFEPNACTDVIKAFSAAAVWTEQRRVRCAVRGFAATTGIVSGPNAYNATGVGPAYSRDITDVRTSSDEVTFDYTPDAGGGELIVYFTVSCAAGKGSLRVHVNVTPPSIAKVGDALETAIEAEA